MKKVLFIILSLILFSFTISSCDEQVDKKDKSIIYTTAYSIYSSKDSTFTGIKVYVGKVNGHNVTYHVFSGKNKSQMEVWHFESECSKCNPKK